MDDNPKFQKRAKDVIGDLAEHGPESDFVPRVSDDGEVESFDEWYERIFNDNSAPANR